MSPHQILVIVAMICELVAAIGIPVGDRINMIALGLFFFFVSILVP